MPRLEVPADADAWFGEHDGFSGRSVAERASAFAAEAVEESRKSGFPLEPVAVATAFLTEHAGLRVRHDVRRDDCVDFTPVPVWGDLFEDTADFYV
ncbi:hypothetical protein ACH4ZU_31785 [Streptomyces sp. NPDC020472]|uniref:hypothetical protein n=1 Tax=Streptomyces sp. NPDC020472 TaxID=3365075 RepID=UPI0037BBE303